MTVTLKKDLGKAGAFLDESGPYDNLHDVLVAMAQGPIGAANAFQATIATATLNAVIASGAGKITGLKTSVGTTGTAGDTTVQVHLNGVSQGELTTSNTEADGTAKSLDLDVDLVEGDLVEIVVSAAPTAGADLAASVKLQPVIVE